ncbi:hypothetical protein G6F61_001702 [Rhizopus arrhizus]|nr:hypothetical protein G6F61_001702 [Rhizopus arrhizus]
MKLVLGCLFALIALEIYYAPFTKVEESFNLQATHDILNQVKHYDHLEFPGVVPRTFVGAMLLSALCWPWTKLIPSITLFDQQILVRATLAAIIVLSLGQFSQGIRVLFSKNTAIITIMLIVCQFHFVFWSSRTLPNTLALPLVHLGLSHWLKSMAQTSDRAFHLKQMSRYLTFAGIVFRFEVGILLVILIFTEWIFSRFHLISIVKTITATALLSLITTVPLDSFFWNQLLWPEGMVFYFNAILNKSSEWGTLPFYAYFTNFLPRLLLISYPLMIVAYARDARVRRVLCPMIIYTLVFSLVPHKEWRFIIYTVPVFTAAAATQVNALLIYQRRSSTGRFGLVVLTGGILASFFASLIMFQISSLNYPGGQALKSLHMIDESTPFVSVHIDAETAMTGASLFGQTNTNWKYSKNEKDTTEEDFIEARYTHVLTANPEKFNSSLFETAHVTYGIGSIRLILPNKIYQDTGPKKEIINLFGIVRLEVALRPKIYTLRAIYSQKTWVQALLRKYPAILFSKTYCPYCKRAKQLIAKYSNSIKIIEVDLEKNSRDIQLALHSISGQYTFPNLFIHSQSFGGFDNLSELDRQGKLSKLFLEQ